MPDNPSDSSPAQASSNGPSVQASTQDQVVTAVIGELDDDLADRLEVDPARNDVKG